MNNIVEPAEHSVARFGDLPDGAYFVNPLLSDRELHKPYEPSDWKDRYMEMHQRFGQLIKVGQFGFMEGTHGEGVERYRDDKLVIVGRQIEIRPDTNQSREILTLCNIFALQPFGLSLDSLVQQIQPASMFLFKADLRRLLNYGLMRIAKDTYFINGRGIRKAVSQGYIPAASPLEPNAR